jgi:hypothetical protein
VICSEYVWCNEWGSFDEVFDVPNSQLLVPRTSDHRLRPQKASSRNVFHMQCQVSQNSGVMGIRLGVPQPCGAISACAQQQFSSGVVVDGADWVEMSQKLCLFHQSIVFHLVPSDVAAVGAAEEPFID